LHIDIHTDELGTDNLDNSWLHHNYSYARTAMDDIDATYALPGMSLTLPVYVIITTI
jgi:hypothetical protein